MKKCKRKELPFLKEESLSLIALSLFDSDYGYYRHENSSECVEQADFTSKKLEVCLNGELEELQTLG